MKWQTLPKGSYLQIPPKILPGLCEYFEEWRCARNKNCTGDEICGANLLDSPDIDSQNFWMPRFVAEVRRQDGKPYPPKTIHQLLAGLQRYMLDKNALAPKFLDQKNPLFRDIHHAYTVHFTSKELGLKYATLLLFLKLKRKSCGLLALLVLLHL